MISSEREKNGRPSYEYWWEARRREEKKREEGGCVNVILISTRTATSATMISPEAKWTLRFAQLTGCLPFTLSKNQISFSWYNYVISSSLSLCLVRHLQIAVLQVQQTDCLLLFHDVLHVGCLADYRPCSGLWGLDAGHRRDHHHFNALGVRMGNRLPNTGVRGMGLNIGNLQTLACSWMVQKNLSSFHGKLVLSIVPFPLYEYRYVHFQIAVAFKKQHIIDCVNEFSTCVSSSPDVLRRQGISKVCGCSIGLMTGKMHPLSLLPEIPIPPVYLHFCLRYVSDGHLHPQKLVWAHAGSLPLQITLPEQWRLPCGLQDGLHCPSLSGTGLCMVISGCHRPSGTDLCHASYTNLGGTWAST